MPALYQLSYLALCWRCPYFVNIFCSGVPVRSHSTVNCRVARDHTQIAIQPGKRHITLKWNLSQNALYYRKLLSTWNQRFFIAINFRSCYKTCTFHLKPVDTFGKQCCPRPTLRVSQLIYKITNLWKFRLNRSSESGENNGKTHPCFRTFRRVMTCVYY